MCRKVAHPFYGSAKWKTRRLKYLETVHFICEECGRPAEQVHHKDPLKEEDYFVNYEKCYGFANLIALCRNCHNRKPGHFLAHAGKQAIAEGYRVNMITGDIEAIPPHDSAENGAGKAVRFPWQMTVERREEEGEF